MDKFVLVLNYSELYV